MTTRTDPEREIATIIETLLSRDPSLPRQRVEGMVRAQWHSYDGARVRDFVPLLVLRGTREQLDDAQRHSGI